MQEMPSALRLYLRSSSTWMFVSGRKSSGARLAGRSRLANTRDRMRVDTKSPAEDDTVLGTREGPHGPACSVQEPRCQGGLIRSYELIAPA